MLSPQYIFVEVARFATDIVTPETFDSTRLDLVFSSEAILKVNSYA